MPILLPMKLFEYHVTMPALWVAQGMYVAWKKLPDFLKILKNPETRGCFDSDFL